MIGPLGDRFGRARVLTVTVAFTAAMALSMGQVTTITELMITRFLIGLSLGAVMLVDMRRADGTGWVVFADPDGNEFCIGRSAAERAAKRPAGNPEE